MEYREREALRCEGITNAKAGDNFYVYHVPRGMGDGRWGSVLIVERVTPTQVVLAGGTRLSKKSFGKVGYDPYKCTVFYPAHSVFRDERNRALNASKVSNQLSLLVDRLLKERRNLPLETQEALVHALEGILNLPGIDVTKGEGNPMQGFPNGAYP